MVKGGQKFYNTKIIETATTKEIWQYEDKISYSEDEFEDGCEIDLRKSLSKCKQRRQYSEMTALEQADSLKRKQKFYEQQRWVIARLVDNNFDSNTKFVTLTFKENIEDISITNEEFKKFIKRLNYYLYKTKKQCIKYIATWEKQKRGAIHYHVIFFDFPYIKNKKLEEIWMHGFIRINKIDVDSKGNRGRYVSKYFGKDLDLKEHKKKAFFKSQNLKLPKIEKLVLKDDEIKKAWNDENIVFTKNYTRKIPDRKVLLGIDEKSGRRHYAFKESKVMYIKIQK